MNAPGIRGRATTVLVGLASLLLVAATLAGYARLAVFDSGRFADRATAALEEPSVRTVVGERVTDGLVLPTEPDLIAARPLIVSAVSGIVGGGAFASLFRRAVRDAHRAVFTRDQDTLTLTLVDVGTVAGAALEKLRPDVAAKLEAAGRVELLKRRIGGATGDLARTADRVRVLAPVLAVLTLMAGVYVLYKGIEATLRLVYQPPSEQAAEADATTSRPRRSRPAPVVAIAALLIGGMVAAFVVGGGVAAPAMPISRCNGHAALCDRPLDEVVLAATHNSMSVPLAGWISAEQDRPIGGQLEDGIHGLLLDTHYGDKLANRRIRTFFGSVADLRRTSREDGVSPQSVDAALRLRERLGFRGSGTRGMYLCHSFCELGATPLQTGLEDIHDFLATHAHEVVVMVNQDYVKPADFVEAIDDAGLTPYAFTPPSGATWPTLREMIEDGQRLVMLAENHAGSAPWYQLAYERLTEETPYAFGSAPALIAPAGLEAGCRANRGPARAPLFLINHWVTTAPIQRPSDADKVNAYDALLRRAQTCRHVRSHLPNLLAVNFYARGDLFRVVDTLNRTGAAAAP